jgi:IS30 family transposase
MIMEGSMAGLNVTRTEIIKIVKLRCCGHKIIDIAAIMGRSKSTIRRVIKESGDSNGRLASTDS